MLFIIMKNLILVACIYGSYKLAQRFFDDDQKLLRIIATFVISVVLFGIANGILSFMTPSVDVDEQLQTEEVFISLKQKHPQEYNAIVEQVSLEIETNSLNKNEVVSMASEPLAALALTLAIDASDDARYEFIKSYTTLLNLLKNQDDTLCYDLMYNQKAITEEQAKTINNLIEHSNMQQAVLKVVNDNKVGKAVASQRDMDAMQTKILKELILRHGQDVQLLASPKMITSAEEKQKVCGLFVDLLNKMNDPNNKVKKALLRHNMQDMSIAATSITSSNSTQVAGHGASAEPQMAGSVY